MAGLLLFRVLYYLVPFAVALSILGAREVWLNMRGKHASAPSAKVPVAAPLETELEAEDEQAG